MLFKALRLLTLVVVMIAGMNQGKVHAANPESVIPKQNALIELWGIEALRVTLSANDYMVDFRYKVIDPEKAAKAVNRKDQPYIRHSDTGLTRVVPAPANIGALRHTGRNLKAGRNYFVLFANPGKTIKRGDEITLVMGGYKLENVTVQ